MGFLTVNTRKRPRQCATAKNKRIKSQSDLTTPSVPLSLSTSWNLSRLHIQANCLSSHFPEVPRTSPIERLPREILETIFALSSNFNLPQASLILANKLSKTRNLELMLIESQLCASNKLPTYVVHWPFVTRHLLSQLNFSEFIGSITNGKPSSPFVPLGIENRLDSDESVELAAFMVERGCMVENSVRFYKVFAEHNHWKAIDAMVCKKQRADVEVILSVLKSGKGAALAIELLRLAHEVQSDWNQMWEIQQAALEANAPEVNTFIQACL